MSISPVCRVAYADNVQVIEDALESNENIDDDYEEHIVVTRPEEEELDPEAEADFERELAKMMSESLESRRAERRPMLDIALPARRGQRETPGTPQEGTEGARPVAMDTVKFSLLSKRGNRAQVSGPGHLPISTC